MRQSPSQLDGAVNDIAGQLLGHILNTTTRTPTFYNLFPNLRTAQENVVIAPTAEQIANSTEELVYSSDVLLSNTSCPITLEDFQDGDALQRILQCRHTFKRAAIQNWFQRNVRCPVCRYDIRDYEHIYSPRSDPLRSSLPSSVIEQEEDLDGEFQDLVNELEEEARSTFIAPATSITSTLTNAVRTFINNELQRIPVSTAARELLYTFDIPITIDMSGNYRL
jgi:hypothetical protein